MSQAYVEAHVPVRGFNAKEVEDFLFRGTCKIHYSHCYFFFFFPGIPVSPFFYTWDNISLVSGRILWTIFVYFRSIEFEPLRALAALIAPSLSHVLSFGHPLERWLGCLCVFWRSMITSVSVPPRVFLPFLLFWCYTAGRGRYKRFFSLSYSLGMQNTAAKAPCFLNYVAFLHVM